MAKIYQSSATVTLHRASRMALCKAAMKPVVPAEVSEEVMLRETRTGLGSRIKLTTKTITKLLSMLTLGLVVVEDVTRVSVEVEEVTRIAQLEAVGIVGAVAGSKTKKGPSSTLRTKAPS